MIVGLPYANLGSPELVERMKYVKSLEEARGESYVREKGMKDAGAELYENMCMNAVNQSIGGTCLFLSLSPMINRGLIGRAIRHGHDWASLVLLDKRFGAPSIRNKLPKWIGGKLLITGGFGQTVKEMGAFYRHKRP